MRNTSNVHPFEPRNKTLWSRIRLKHRRIRYPPVSTAPSFSRFIHRPTQGRQEGCGQPVNGRSRSNRRGAAPVKDCCCHSSSDLSLEPAEVARDARSAGSRVPNCGRNPPNVGLSVGPGRLRAAAQHERAARSGTKRAGDRSRTRDILITSEALYQLSYTGDAAGTSRALPAADAIVGDRSAAEGTAPSQFIPTG